MRYIEYREAKQKSFNELPIFFAFSNEQFKEAMEERGLTENDTDKIYALGAGGYYLRSDADLIRAWFSKKDDLKKMMKNYDFAEDAIFYEMCNHEYGINMQGNYDVFSCFGKVKYVDDDYDETQYFKQLRWNQTQKDAFYAARIRYSREAEKNDWF